MSKARNLQRSLGLRGLKLVNGYEIASRERPYKEKKTAVKKSVKKKKKK